jgi:preprotein translocase subunit SecY
MQPRRALAAGLAVGGAVGVLMRRWWDRRTRYGTWGSLAARLPGGVDGVGLALVQSIGIVAGLQNSRAGIDVLINDSILTYITIGLVCTAGTAFLVWMGEMITEKGVGNGVSIIIFASICARVPTTVESYISGVIGGQYRWWVIPLMLVIVLVMVTGVTFIERSERRIPVQYAKRVVGRKLYGGQSTHIPLKANANGVMPLIFAMTIMQFPAMIGQFWPDSAFYTFYTNYMSASSDYIIGPIVYYVIYSLLILGFAYFYTTISFNPVEISKNLQQNGGFIPGIRPGRPTGEHLQKICNRLTLFGAVYLMILAVVPTVTLGAFDLTTSFGPTSILIMVSVALETSSQLESMMLMRHYKGFLG